MIEVWLVEIEGVIRWVWRLRRGMEQLVALTCCGTFTTSKSGVGKRLKVCVRNMGSFIALGTLVPHILTISGITLAGI